jgi:hypothetical protein
MSGDAYDILDLAKVDAGKMSFEKTPLKWDHLLIDASFIRNKNSRENLKLVKNTIQIPQY